MKKKGKRAKKRKLNKKRVAMAVLILIAIIAAIVLSVKSKSENKYESEPTSADEIVENTTDLNESGNEISNETGNTNEVTEENNTSNEITNTNTNTGTSTSNNNTNPPSSKMKYYIRVNYTANCVTVYKKDDNGDYTVPVKAMVCSTGTATPKSGTYKTTDKYRWHLLEGNVYGQYCMRITGHILFHSVPYFEKSPSTLEYEEYDKLGTTASAGCIRLAVEDTKWIYDNCSSGTYVNFYSDSDPGPLGKPSAQKITSNTECRGWDPTDPDSSNPWHNYSEQGNGNTENAPIANNPNEDKSNTKVEEKAKNISNENDVNSSLDNKNENDA